MAEAVSPISSEVGRLSGYERAEPAIAVLSSLGPAAEQCGEAWEAGLDRRVEEIRHGRAGRRGD